MNIEMTGETEQHLSQFMEDGLNITLANEALYYGAITMFVTSLGRCTFAVLESYAGRLGIDADSITMTLTWDFTYEPTRISAIEMNINWPELPEKRLKSVERAAHLCTIHNTIHDCVSITTHVKNA